MKVTKKLLLIVIKQASANLSQVVTILKNNHRIEITRDAIDDRIRNNPELKKALESADANLDDLAEYGLAKELRDTQRWAIKYRLDRKERRDELSDRRTGGSTEDEEMAIGVNPPAWEVEGITNEEWCANLKKKKEKNNDNPNS